MRLYHDACSPKRQIQLFFSCWKHLSYSLQCISDSCCVVWSLIVSVSSTRLPFKVFIIQGNRKWSHETVPGEHEGRHTCGTVYVAKNKWCLVHRFIVMDFLCSRLTIFYNLWRMVSQWHFSTSKCNCRFTVWPCAVDWWCGVTSC